MKILLPETEPQGLAGSGEQRGAAARGPGRLKFGGGNVKVLLPETKAQGIAGSGEQREADIGRLCWRRPPRKAFYLRRGTPTWSGLSRTPGAYVGVDLPAKPFTSVEARQHGQDYPGRRAPMLASTSPQSLLPPSRHANMIRIFPARRAPGKAKIEKIRTCR